MATSTVQTQPLYGGLLNPSISDIQVDMAATAKPKRTSQRKQSKATKVEDDAKKAGKRGRPRVDTHNENAVERRRTQIRLAQRAYRERKETAITALEDQVSRLQQTISTMNELFSGFNEEALNSGIMTWNPDLGDSLKSTIDGILQLVQNAGVEDGKDDRPRKEPRKRRRSSENTTEVGDTISSGFEEMDFGSVADTNTLKGQQFDSDCPWGYRMLYNEDQDSTTIRTNPVTEPQEIFRPDQMTTADWMDTAKDIQRLHPEISNAPSFTEDWMSGIQINKHITPVITYSFQESTFARRLLRDSYERTYEVLTSRNPPPEKLHHLFRYALCFGNLNTITLKIKEILSRSAQEPLGVWELPTLHIGGAGLHFPRTDSSEVPPVQGWNTMRNVGPFPIHRGQTPPPAEFFPYDVDVFKGIEGTWFDSHDVEHYLKTKGLFLTGSCSVAEMEVDSSVLPTSAAGTPRSGSLETISSTDTISSPHSPNAPPGQVTEFFSPSVDYLLSKVAADDLSSTAGFDFDFTLLQSADADKGDGELDAAPINLFGHLPAFDMKPPQKRKVTIDVDKLLDALNSRAVCLGRTPGYRQSDVDAALSKVLLEAW